VINLPKRSDPIYKEIEAFEDYEITQCIAYEMAVRGKEDFGIIAPWELEKVEKYKLTDVDLYGFSNLYQKVNEFYPTYLETTRKNAFKLFKEDLTIQKQEIDEEILMQMFKQGSNYHFQELSNDLSYFINNFLMNNEEEFRDIVVPTLTEDIKVDKPLLIDLIKNSNKSLHIPFIKYSRPIISNNLSISSKLYFNLALPLTELKAQIAEIKKNFDTDKTIVLKTTELLGTELQKTDNSKFPKTAKQKLWADAFFIYDYVEARFKQIENENAIIQQEYEKEVEEIKQSKIYNSFDKKIQLAQLAKEHNSNLINTGVKDIFNENELLKDINASSGTASNRYYLIKPYIDECRYKELLSGVTNI